MSAQFNGMSISRSQSSDGESLPDDVFHDDSNTGGVGGASFAQAPPSSSGPPPKPPRISGGSRGIASFINKNPETIREILKRTSSEEDGCPKSTPDSNGSGGRAWSFKGGKGMRQQSVPVDVNLAGSKKSNSQIRAENGSSTRLTGNESSLTRSVSVSPQPTQDDTQRTKTTATNSITSSHPPVNSSTQSSQLDLETVHEGIESSPAPAKPARSSNRQITFGTDNESKPLPKPRYKQQQSRTKLYSDSQVMGDDSKLRSSEGGSDKEPKKPGIDTLERDNMLLREQIKLLKGQNKKLKRENKEYRHKLHDDEEWDLPTSPSSHSESVTPSVISPEDSTQSSQVSSRVHSESPSHETPTERGRLNQAESNSVGNFPSRRETGLKLDDETSLEVGKGEIENDDEVNDEVLGSLSSTSSHVGRGAAPYPQGGLRSSSIPSMSTPDHPKPIPVPRSVAVSVGRSGDVVKSSGDKAICGFEVKGKDPDLDSVPGTVQTVKLESYVAKLDSPVPKTRGTSQVSFESSDYKDRERPKSESSDGGVDNCNKVKDDARKTLESLIPHTGKQQMVGKPMPLPRSMSVREDELKKELPLTQRAASTSPVRKVGTVTLGVGAKSPPIPENKQLEILKTDNETTAAEEDEAVETVDGSEVSGNVEDNIKSSNRGTVGVEIVGTSGAKTVGESSKDSAKSDGDGDERTASTSSNRSMISSLTLSTSSVGKGSSPPITKPLPPTPTIAKTLPPATPSSTTKPLPPTPPSSTKPLPSTPPTNVKPLPPTPSSSSKPLPPPPYASTKPLPPTPSSNAKPLPPAPIKVGVSSTPVTSTSSPPASAGIKDLTGSISPRTPTTRVVGTGYKKVTIQSDTSWINRRKAAEKGSTDSTTTEPTKATSVTSNTSQTGGAVSRPVAIQAPTTSRPHAPYRSHAILPTPSPTTTKSFMSPAMGYGTSPSVTELKGPPTGKLPPPKLLTTRTRTESTSGADQPSKKGGAKGSTESPLLRSSSEENIISQLNDKPKGQRSGGFFSRVANKKEAPAPKKPARPWLRAKEKGSPPTNRPMSALIANKPPDDHNFTASCTVSTMPRGGQLPDEGKYSPKSSRRKKATSDQDLANGSPGRKPKGILGRFKNRSSNPIGTPPLEEEPEDDISDSSSDDEKGGTIKFKPKLRHVSEKKSLTLDDDSEPEYHQLFEYVFVVGLKEKPGANKGKLTTEQTYSFPPASDAAKKDIALQSIPQFCFPDVDQWKPVRDYKSESFSFVLTDMEGHRRFGYCRRLLPQGTGKRLPEVYCIVSPLGCFSLYEKILDHVEERRSVANAVSVFTFLKAIVANPFPRPGRSVQVPVISARGTGMETVVFERPMDSRLEHVDFSLLFNTLSQRKVIQLFSSLLMERRVILCAQSLSLLSGCAHALLALLYPFEWQHVFIPVLPGSLIDFVCSPLPYIIGINPSCIKQIETMETMEEALIVDLDKKKSIRKIGDETSILPTKLSQYLEHSLGSAVVSGEYSKRSSDAASRSRADEIVVNTFMTFFAYLYGDYKRFLTDSSGGQKEFQRREFVKKFSSKSTKRFLEAFQMTQMFENFIEQRENPSKAAMVAESLFEKKIPDLSLGCKEIEIFSSKSRFDRWRIKKGFAKNN